MSLQNYDPGSLKRKRQLTGSSDSGEGSGGRDPGGLRIGPSVAPAHRVLLQGRKFDAT